MKLWKKCLSGLFASTTLTLANAQTPLPEGAEFKQTLSNGQTVAIDCDTLANGKKTLAFLSQYEDHNPSALEGLPEQQKQIIEASRKNKSTHPAAIANMETHLQDHDNIPIHEINAAHYACLSLQK